MQRPDVVYLAYRDKHDRKRFHALRQRYPHARVATGKTYGEALQRALLPSPFSERSEWVFIVDDDEVLLPGADLSRVPEDSDPAALQVWNTDNEDKWAGVKLLNQRVVLSGEHRHTAFRGFPVKWHEVTWSTYRKPDVDIVFLAYDEPNADENLAKLRARFGERVWEVRGVKGIDRAHLRCSQVSTTDWFYVVDGDNEVSSDFHFDYFPKVGEDRFVHVWMSRNGLVPELVYGYGGVKLFRKEFFKQLKFEHLDFSTKLAAGVKYHSGVASTTRFNSDELRTWRATFREVTKLLLSGSEEAKTRLELWRKLDRSQPFALAALQGIQQAEAFVSSGDLALIAELVNDFDKLSDLWSKTTRQFTHDS